MEDRDPDLYNIDFGTVYDVDFEVIDEEVYTQATATSAGRLALSSNGTAIEKSPGHVFIDMEKVDRLSRRIIAEIVESDFGRYYPWQILDRVRTDWDEELTADEANELIASIAGSPFIHARKSGSFTPRQSEEELQGEREERHILSLNFQGRSTGENSVPIPPARLNKILKVMRQSPELKKAKELAKRIENPKRRGRRKKNKLQGRAHNKASGVQRLIEQLNATSTAK